jgi:hypothetical protein
MKDLLQSLICLAIYIVINTPATVTDARDNTSADRHFRPTRERGAGPVRDPFDRPNGTQKPPPIQAVVGSERWFLH